MYAYNMNPIYSFAVWNTIMGSSLLTMPWGMQNSGLLMGIVTIVIMGGLCLYTTHKILQVQMRHGKSDFRFSFIHVHAWRKAAVEQQEIN
jgi:amino acid permease